MKRRVNVGCGNAPTKGWSNYDNSLSLRLAYVPGLARMLRIIGLLDHAQFEFSLFARRNDVKIGNAVKGLPLESNSCDVVYSLSLIHI